MSVRHHEHTFLYYCLDGCAVLNSAFLASAWRWRKVLPLKSALSKC